MAIICKFCKDDLNTLRDFLSKIKNIQSRASWTMSNKWNIIYDFYQFIIDFKNFISKYKMIYSEKKDGKYYDYMINECSNCINKQINLSNLQAKTLIFLNHVSIKYRRYNTILAISRKNHILMKTSFTPLLIFESQTTSSEANSNDSLVPPL